MDSLDYHQIKGYCREALEISDEYGVHDGLTYLIGEKFCPLMAALRQTESKIKYKYNSEEEGSLLDSVSESRPVIRENYSMTVESTYQKLQDQLDNLKRLRDDFVAEIKEAFELTDIQDFLESYPRLGFNDKKQPFWEQVPDEIDHEGMDIADILSEVDDIYMVEDIRKYFS